MIEILRVYRVPILLWALSVGGIALALLGDGHLDFAAWTGLGLLLAVCGRAVAPWLRQRGGTRRGTGRIQ